VGDRVCRIALTNNYNYIPASLTGILDVERDERLQINYGNAS